jgi:hypothetical protein
MSRVEHKLGLSPVLKRLAFNYLKLGIGSHAIEHHIYDEVQVSELYEWHAPENRDLQPRGGLVVAFCREGKRIRWVEFSCSFIGGGGAAIMRET